MTFSTAKFAAQVIPVVPAGDHPVSPAFIARYAPHAFSGETMPDGTLRCVFEAARWAPSASGARPWRFVYAKRDTPVWPQFLGFLSAADRTWAENAAALIVVLSKSPSSSKRKPAARRTASFEAGAAWAALAFQAFLTGWSAYAVECLNGEAVCRELNAPFDHSVEAIVAIGRRSPTARELPPSGARPPASAEMAFEAAFPARA
ncbi:MAG: nitroreductase family protein [Hyphomicrobiales bacterium]|nr:nitroreductase family protein [Hyphomicrobiales bacterium]